MNPRADLLKGMSRRFRFVQWLPVLTGFAMLATNRWFTAVDDECALVDTAFHPLRYTLSLFLNGEGQHRHPPLSDIALHLWLVITQANFHLLRLPFIFLYVIGAYALAGAAKYVGGEKGEAWVLGMVALWPYGFHYGRVAGWYCFCFAAVCLLTFAYFKFNERPSGSRWVWLVLAILAAVYSNYFCWLLVALLGFDFWARHREDFASWRLSALGTTLLILALYYPVFHAFFHLLRKEGVFHFSPLSTLAYGTYSLYCTFVSESVAPWFWILGVPAGIAIALCIGLTLWLSDWPAKRFLLYFILCFAALAIGGIEETKHLVLVGPWVILAVGTTIATLADQGRRRALIVSTLVPGLIGWFGILDRQLYAAPHWVEPWQQIAEESADLIRSGGIAIANNPSYFFYLTYELPADNPPGSGQVWGLLPGSVRHANVFTPSQWVEDGRPLHGNVLFITGMHFFMPEEPDVETERALDSTCNLLSDTKLVRDAGARWKNEFEPGIGSLEWRVEVRKYSCPEENAVGDRLPGPPSHSLR